MAEKNFSNPMTKKEARMARAEEKNSKFMEHIKASVELKSKTEKLLRRIDIKPRPFESVYS